MSDRAIQEASQPIKQEENQKRSLYEPAANHQAVHARMKNSFTSMYQTILSIIQGVALADLAASVAARYQQLTLVHLLMILTTFGILIVVFQVYWIQSAVWGWIPDVRDAAIPFVFGALELFLNHTIFLSMGLWFLGLTGISGLGALGTVHLVWRARGEIDNAELLNMLKGHHQLFLLYYSGAAVISLLFAYICFVANLQASDGVQGMRGMLALSLVLLIAISLVASSLLSNSYWHKAVVYARTGNITRQKNMHKRKKGKVMKRIFRTAFVMLGILSFILTAGLCLQVPLVTSLLPRESSFPLHTFLASITASITASLLWIGFSGELGAVAGGAIDLAVFYAGLTLFQLLSPQHGSQRLLAGVLLCLVGAIVSLGIFLWFRRYPIEDRRSMPLPVRVSFGVFVVVLILVGSALLLQVPNVFAWTLDPLPAALLGCFFLGSACYFLYGLLVPRWHNACGQLWSFLAYDIVLIVPFLLHFTAVSLARLPSLIVNTSILLYSGALALYYLLIKKETRSRVKIKSLSSQAN